MTRPEPLCDQGQPRVSIAGRQRFLIKLEDKAGGAPVRPAPRLGWIFLQGFGVFVLDPLERWSCARPRASPGERARSCWERAVGKGGSLGLLRFTYVISPFLITTSRGEAQLFPFSR